MDAHDASMAPRGAYESQEAREAQPTTTANASPGSSVASVEIPVPGTTGHTENDTEMQVDDDASHVSPVEQEEKQEGQGRAEENVVVNLKFLHRERITLTCSADILVADLKQRVRAAYIQAIQEDGTDSQASQQHEPHPETQPLRLIYKGKVLQEDTTLGSYNFISEDTIHAIFSRPAPAPSSEASATDANTANASADGNQSGSASESGGEDGSSSVFVFPMRDGEGLPDISRLINTIVNSAMNASDGGETTATIRVFPVPSNGGDSASGSSASSTSTTAASASAQTGSASAPTTSHSTPHPQRNASVAPTGTPNAAAPIPATTSQPQPTQSSTHSGPTSLLNQAAALRRSIPALELAPLSRPGELSPEMYNLGNAMRESGDTYLAIHRQLQFLASRFLQENHLNASERARLRTRVQELIPVMQQLSQLSSSVSQQLAGSSYGHAPVTGHPTSQPSTSGSGFPQAQRSTTSGASSPPADSLVDFIRMVSGNQTSSNQGTPAAQAVGALPAVLSFFSALAGSAPSSSGSFGSSSTPQTTANTAVGGGAATGTHHSRLMPFGSLASQLQELISSNPNLVNASIDEFLRSALPLIDRHIVTCYGAGSTEFVQNGVDEVENALRLFDQAHSRHYAVLESRRSIVRLAMQELAQISLPMAASLEARSADLQSWMRRSCSNLFAELCEVASASTAADMTSMIVAQLLSGNSTVFLNHHSPFLDRLATETRQFLQRRLQFS